MHLKHNISLFYILSGIGWFRFFIPVLALFYVASQVPLEQFGLIMGVFSLSIFLLEIPSGIVADLLGKKNTLVLSRFLYIIEVYILAFHTGFWPFLIAKMISGFGVSLHSGANSALLYDTLKKLKREKEHKKISGTMFTIANVCMAFVFIIGAYLFAINPKLPALASLPFIVLGFLLALFLQEPYKNKKKLTFSNSIKHLKEGFVYASKHDYVKYLIFFSWPIAAAIHISLSMSSAYLEKILVPVYLIGVVAFFGSLIVAFTSKKAHTFEEKHGDKTSLLIIQALALISLALMSFMAPLIGILFYYIIMVVYGLFEVLVNHYMNVHIKTSHRATMLSIKNFGNNAAMFLLFPLFGFMTKSYSMSYAFLSLGLIVLLAILWLHMKSRNWKISKLEYS